MGEIYSQLSLRERVQIDLPLEEGLSVSAVARRLGRAVSTISREVRGNARPTKAWAGDHDGERAHGLAPGAARPLAPAGVAEAVGKLGSVIREHRVDRVQEGSEETLTAGGGSLGVAPRHDLDPDETDGAVDGDEDVSMPAVKPGQALQIDMDEADRRGLEAARSDVSGFGRREMPWRRSRGGWRCAKGAGWCSGVSPR